MPGKAAWLALEENHDLEFEYFLAQKLSMTRARMIAEMSNAEFVYWSRFYSRREAENEVEAAKAGG